MTVLQFKLATWNLHRCIGRDGVMSPGRCAAVLNRIDADMIALQEVESRPGDEQDTLALLPARVPLLSLDRIWVHPRQALVRIMVHRSALARVASDHLPLIAEISVE